MKTLLLTLVIASFAVAQDLHGVSVIDEGWKGQMLVNNSDKAVLAYVARRITTKFSPVFPVTDFNSWASGKTIQPGEHRSMFSIQKLRFENEGDVKGYEIVAVLFEDGSYYGPDFFQNVIARSISNVRDLAMGIQPLAAQDRATLLMFHKKAGQNKAHAGSGVDRPSLDDRSTMADVLLGLPPESMDAALARLAAMPTIRKGEQQ